MKTDKQLTKLCQEWQKILRLQDWKIRTGYLSACDLDADSAGKSLAKVQFDVFHKEAEIFILHPDELPPECTTENTDPEHSLVHELVHLHMIRFAPIEVDNIDEEQAANLLAEALVGLKRGNA